MLYNLADALVKRKQDPEVAVNDDLGGDFGQREEGGEEKKVHRADVRSQFKFQRTKKIAKDAFIFQA